MLAVFPVASATVKISVIGLRLPRRRARRVHGKARARRGRHRPRSAQGRGARRRRAPVLRTRASTSCSPRSVATGRLTVSAPTPRWRAGAPGALRLRGHAAGAGQQRGGPDVRGRRRRRRCCRTSPPGDLVVGKSTVPVGTAERLAGVVVAGAAGGRARLEPRVPPRGLRRQGHPRTRTGSSTACPTAPRASAATALLDEVYAGRSAEHTPRIVTDYADRGAGQGRRQLVPGHEDLVHQRDGRDRRGRGRRRHAARRRDRPRRPDRPPVPQRRPRLRRRLPAQGHPRLHGARRRARRRPGGRVPRGGRRDQHPAPRPHGRPRGRGARRIRGRPPHRRARRVLQARLRRRARLARAGRRGPAGRGRRGGHRHRPRAPSRTRAPAIRSCTTSRTSRRP